MITSRMKIWIETQSDVMRFVQLASAMDPQYQLNIVDNYGMCVNARSLMGVMYATEFKHMWLESDTDRIYSVFECFQKE